MIQLNCCTVFDVSVSVLCVNQWIKPQQNKREIQFCVVLKEGKQHNVFHRKPKPHTCSIKLRAPILEKYRIQAQ